MGLGFAGRARQLFDIGFGMALYPLAKAAPRSSRKWVFGHSGDKFLGNPKYLYLWMLQNRPDIDVKWITGDTKVQEDLSRQGLPVIKRSSMKGVLATLRAGVFVFSHHLGDVNLPLSPGAFPLNLWHGVGLKSLYTHRMWPKGAWGWARSFIDPNPVMVVSTSDTMRRHFSEQFRIDPSGSPILGYPRTDVSSDARLRDFAVEIDQASGFRYNREAFDEVYVYVPTFRDSKRPFLERAIPDWDRLNAVLRERNAVLYLKLHPRTADSSPADGQHIRNWPPEIDLQSYMSRIDCLITDYSSVLYDYLYDRSSGVVIYAFDLEEYRASDRTMVAPLDENVVGVMAHDFDELCATLRTGAALGPVDQRRLTLIRERFWGAPSASSSAAVVDWTLGQLTDQGRSATA